MEARREQVLVGLFVIVAASLLVLTVFSLTGVFASATKTYHAKFPNAAGLEPGTTVRYAGGPKVGRVEKLEIDPANPGLSFSPLGDNHLEIKPGSSASPRATDGAWLAADSYVGFNDLTQQINELTPQARELLANLNDRVTQLRITLDRVNDLLNDQNRQNISNTISELHGILEENRPQIKSTLNNVSQASAKIGPLLDQIHGTIEQANGTLKKVDSLVGDNREDIRASVIKLRESLENVATLTGQLQRTLDNNVYNIVELLNNLRIVSENLKQFTDTIKTRPSSLISPGKAHDRKPGDKQ